MQSDLLLKLWLRNAGGEEHAKYKQQLIGMLKAGQLVVQMLAAEEVMTMPDGSRKATFLLDTWDMVLPLLLPQSQLPLRQCCCRCCNCPCCILRWMCDERQP